MVDKIAKEFIKSNHIDFTVSISKAIIKSIIKKRFGEVKMERNKKGAMVSQDSK